MTDSGIAVVLRLLISWILILQSLSQQENSTAAAVDGFQAITAQDSNGEDLTIKRRRHFDAGRLGTTPEGSKGPAPDRARDEVDGIGSSIMDDPPKNNDVIVNGAERSSSATQFPPSSPHFLVSNDVSSSSSSLFKSPTLSPASFSSSSSSSSFSSFPYSVSFRSSSSPPASAPSFSAASASSSSNPSSPAAVVDGGAMDSPAAPPDAPAAVVDGIVEWVRFYSRRDPIIKTGNGSEPPGNETRTYYSNALLDGSEQFLDDDDGDDDGGDGKIQRRTGDGGGAVAGADSKKPSEANGWCCEQGASAAAAAAAASDAEQQADDFRYLDDDSARDVDPGVAPNDTVDDDVAPAGKDSAGGRSSEGKTKDEEDCWKDLSGVVNGATNGRLPPTNRKSIRSSNGGNRNPSPATTTTATATDEDYDLMKIESAEGDFLPHSVNISKDLLWLSGKGNGFARTFCWLSLATVSAVTVVVAVKYRQEALNVFSRLRTLRQRRTRLQRTLEEANTLLSHAQV